MHMKAHLTQLVLTSLDDVSQEGLAPKQHCLIGNAATSKSSGG